MTQLQPKYPISNLLQGLAQTNSCNCKHNYAGSGSIYYSVERIWKISNGISRMRYRDKKKSNFVKRRMEQCCISSAEKMGVIANVNSSEEEFGYLVNNYAGWKVRRLAENDEAEMKSVAQVQAQAFHVPVLLFDDIFFQFFQAEVLSGLLYRLRKSPPDRYASLVAEAVGDETETRLVGVVDVTVQRDESVLGHFSGAEEYLYISGIAVLNSFRRRKVATALLKACDVLSHLWGYKYMALRAYEDDLGARKLYANAGYSIVSGDPHWMTSWVGKRRRVLMAKTSPYYSPQGFHRPVLE
ncbi:GNAT domain [Dillenia turbinata]|uniref:GNAT domain n=1 Tax=Dillenia turbinata TaxID=194707 RepID=A0AAN8VMX6_9MAGN